MKMSISLAHEFGDNIFTRSTISNFFKKLNSLKNKEITLDFKGIKFISRSCADEYLKQKKESPKKIIEVSMSEDICNMFKNVKNQYENTGIEISFEICPDQGGLILA